MATKELQELRNKYKAAYTGYVHSVQAISDATRDGVWPPAEVVNLEERAIKELIDVRRALLDTLYAHSMRTRTGGSDRSK